MTVLILPKMLKNFGKCASEDATGGYDSSSRSLRKIIFDV